MSPTTTLTETTPVIETTDNRDMKLPTISFLDALLIGADESEQSFGSWGSGANRCALGAAALGAQKMGLM